MGYEVTTAWILPPRDITGEDHLALRAVGEAIYTELVPCVTNVTERIRHYTFFPWFTWKFARERRDADYDEFVRLFRRAECLNTLIGAHHETGGSSEMHGAGLAGRGTLLDPLRDLGSGSLRLSTYADPGIDGAERYFKAQLGGLDQYYRGTLQSLDVMGGNRQSGLKVTPRRGVRLAEAFDAGVPGDLFWDTVVRDEVSAKRLDELSAFCPCQLEHQQREVSSILDVLLNRDRAADVPDMRDAVRLVCDFLAAQNTTAERGAIVWDFRESAYGGVVAGGAWIDPALPKWAAYHRHELLSVAVQSLFWAVFRAVEDADAGGQLPVLHSSSRVAEWFIGRHEADLGELDLTRPVLSVFEQAMNELPIQEAIADEGHELRQAQRLMAEEEIGPATVGALRLLTSLIARMSDEPPYGGFGREEAYFTDYPVNLRTLRSFARGKWQSLTMRDWLSWLVTHWCVGHHLRVALRKLHAQGIDTFRLRPTELGLQPIRNIDVGYGNPRLDETLRALRDLGMINAQHQLTQAGELLRKELHG